MKVAIVGQTLNKNFKGKISGGIQTVERLHVKIFLESGWDVDFIAPNDSEEFVDHPRFNLVKMPTPSLESASAVHRNLKARINKDLTGAIRDQLLANSTVDLVINHSFSSSHTRLMAELSEKLPILNFVHNTPDTAMDIGIIAKVQHYLKLTQNGGKLVCVSRYQRDLWRRALKKRVASGGKSFTFLTSEDVDLIYDAYCYPVYVEKHVVAQPQSHFAVISRPDPIKNVSKLLELLLRGNPIKLYLFLAHPGDLQANDYYVKEILPWITELLKKGFEIKVCQNAERQNLLNCLASAKGCFIPCTVEAAPVVLLEAASRGVPSIVFGRTTREGIFDHAAVDLLGLDHIKLVNVTGNKEAAAQALSEAIDFLPSNWRENLQELTYRRHSFEQRVEDMFKIVDSMKQPTREQPRWEF